MNPTALFLGFCALALVACTTKTGGTRGTGGSGAGGSSVGTGGGGVDPGSGGGGAGTGGGGAMGPSGGQTGSGGRADAGTTDGAAGTTAVDASPGDVVRQDAAIACNAPVMATPAMSIAGTWTFTPTGGAATTIQVPGGGWFKQGFNIATATYTTRITVPALPMAAPQTTLIEFGAVNHQAALSVDGMLVATNMTSFTPSVFDVSRFATPGVEHAISVVVSGRNAFTAGGKSVPDGANWSANVPQGIFRSATVRVYPDVYVSDVFVRTSVATGTIAYDVSVTNTSARSRTLTLGGTLDSWNCDNISYPALPSANVTVAANQTAKVTVGPVPWGLGPETYWWPNVPYQATYNSRLHNLRVALREGGALVHERLTRFGFREVTQARADVQNVYYYLNGVRVNVRGDSLNGMDYDSIALSGTGPGDAYDTLPGFMPPSATNPGWPQAVRNYQRLNYNLLRLHQEPGSPYVLDVADELGMMIIDETAIRGPSDQNFVLGHDNMVNHARALVLRDRNHPSIIRWSQSNEPNISGTDSIQFERDLYTAMTTLDPTRPISVDVSGAATAYETIVYPNFAVFGHYLMGLGLYTDDVGARTDRPYGQGEFVWPADVTKQGMMWFATSTAAMRAKNASDIRPYTLLSGWASVIPGVTTQMMLLEPTYPALIVNHPLYGEDNLPDPWSNPILLRQQVAFNPVLVADLPYWEVNKMSNANGDWPMTMPAVGRDVDVARTLTIFNDTFSGTSVSVVWEVHADTPTGAMASTGTLALDVPLGSRLARPITMHTPAVGTRAYLVLHAQKNGVTVFDDTATVFTLTP